MYVLEYILFGSWFIFCCIDCNLIACLEDMQVYDSNSLSDVLFYESGFQPFDQNGLSDVPSFDQDVPSYDSKSTDFASGFQPYDSKSPPFATPIPQYGYNAGCPLSLSAPTSETCD